jgi:sugar lactone lactonase YvrE
MAGADSYLNDVKFRGGHGGMSRTTIPGKPGAGHTGPAHPGTPDSGDWDTQYWSLWITNGGGGTFKNIWTANTYASSGAYISNTTTSGRIYAMSVEHHVRNEIRFNNVSNWKVYALQLEEENRESTECQPMELENCSNMVFANLYLFRVIRVTKPYSSSIRKWGGNKIEFLNVHNYSQTKYTTTAPLYDINTNTEIRPWEFTRLYIGDEQEVNSSSSMEASASPQVTAQPRQLATGFEFAQSVCPDSKGNIYFCESRMRRIYKWSADTRSLSLLADYPWEPLSLACDKKDNLLVVFKYVPQPGWLVNGKQEAFSNLPDAAGTSFSGWGNSGFGTLVYAIDPEFPDESIRLLAKAPMGGITTIEKAFYPAHRWRDYHDFNTISVNKALECFVAPDSVTIVPVVYDLARSTALAAASPGLPLYISDEYDKRTVRLQVGREGWLSGLTYFAQRGEFASATDKSGNVYIADGEIYVYDPSGKQTGVIKIPERPTGIGIGGGEKQILYITGHHSLYSMEIPQVPGIQ